MYVRRFNRSDRPIVLESQIDVLSSGREHRSFVFDKINATIIHVLNVVWVGSLCLPSPPRAQCPSSKRDMCFVPCLFSTSVPSSSSHITTRSQVQVVRTELVTTSRISYDIGVSSRISYDIGVGLYGSFTGKVHWCPIDVGLYYVTRTSTDFDFCRFNEQQDVTDAVTSCYSSTVLRVRSSSVVSSSCPSDLETLSWTPSKSIVPSMVLVELYHISYTFSLICLPRLDSFEHSFCHRLLMIYGYT